MTIAPELPGAHEAIAALVNRGIVPSFGHSGADYAQTARGIRVGIRHATHLFNAMLPLRHREPGPVPALLEAEEVTVQLIFDGAHVHPSVLRLAARLLGPERLVLISDGTRAMGLPGRLLRLRRAALRVARRDGLVPRRDADRHGHGPEPDGRARGAPGRA